MKICKIIKNCFHERAEDSSIKFVHSICCCIVLNIMELWHFVLIHIYEAVRSQFCWRTHIFSFSYTSIIHTFRARGVQDGVLGVPSGVSKLMDLLSDNREVIRNHMLLVLTHITRGNATLQKIVVFENIYDILFDIIR